MFFVLGRYFLSSVGRLDVVMGSAADATVGGELVISVVRSLLSWRVFSSCFCWSFGCYAVTRIHSFCSMAFSALVD